MKVKKYLFELTPLGKADKEVKDHLEENLSDEKIDNYRDSLNQYRHMKVIQGAIKILLYAGIVTSVFVSFGFDQLMILQRITSYIGTTLIFALYTLISYTTMIKRENYHVQREILIAKSA